MITSRVRKIDWLVIAHWPCRNTVWVAVCSLLVLVGCSEHSAGQRYFPLRPGLQWVYQVDRTTMDGHQELRHVVSTIRTASDEKLLGIRTWLNGARYQYTETDDGIVRAAIEGTSFIDPQFPTFPDRLVLPHDTALGVSWQAPGRTSVLENTGPPWETLYRITVPLTITYEVKARDASIETPMGTFVNCLLVEGRGQVNADVGNYIGRAEISVHTREWYAPEVGLVFLHRIEQTDAQALNAGELKLALIDWRQ